MRKNKAADDYETDDMIIGELRKDILALRNPEKPKKPRARRKAKVIACEELPQVKEFIRAK